MQLNELRVGKKCGTTHSSPCRVLAFLLPSTVSRSKHLASESPLNYERLEQPPKETTETHAVAFNHIRKENRVPVSELLTYHTYYWQSKLVKTSEKQRFSVELSGGCFQTKNAFDSRET